MGANASAISPADREMSISCQPVQPCRRLYSVILKPPYVARLDHVRIFIISPRSPPHVAQLADHPAGNGMKDEVETGYGWVPTYRSI